MNGQGAWWSDGIGSVGECGGKGIGSRIPDQPGFASLPVEDGHGGMIGCDGSTHRPSVLTEGMYPMVGVRARFAPFRHVVGVGSQQRRGTIWICRGAGTGQNIEPVGRIGGIKGAEIR